MKGLVSALLFALVASSGQQPDEVHVSASAYTPPSLRLTAQTQLVQLDVVVRDARGRAVGGLKQSDFEIFDDGKPRPIAGFSVETHALSPAPTPALPAGAAPRPATPATAPPRSVLLFFDDLHATAGELRRAQNAASYFVKNSLRPGAHTAIFSASDGLALDFTTDASKLTAAIEGLRSHVRIPEGGLMPCPRISPYQAYLIANNIDPSAMVAAVSEASLCTSADSTVANPYAKSGARAGTNSKLAVTDQISLVVQSQAQQTWDMVRESSLQSYDALAAAITRLAGTPGTRVLLLVSEGLLTGLEETPRQQSIIDSAIHSGIAINALDAKGLWSEPPARPFNEISDTLFLPPQTFQFEAAATGARNSALNATLAEFASGTGGLFFHNNNDLAGGFDQLGIVPETTYLLAFHPDAAGAAGKYHKLKVRLTDARQDYAQARPGYFAPSNATTGEAQRKLDHEATTTDVMADFPVQIAGRLGKSDKGDTLLSLVIHVDLDKLEFTERNGREIQKLEFIGALIDAHGEMIAAKKGMMDLALKEESLARLTASGVNATLTLSAPPGAYRVRVVVQDASGRMTAINQVAEIPK